MAALALIKRIDALRQQVSFMATLSKDVDPVIAPDMRFIDWIEAQTASGLKVDGNPFDLSNRSALRAIYEAIPSTKAEGYGKTFIVMKGAQTGLSVMTFLLQVFLALIS